MTSEFLWHYSAPDGPYPWLPHGRDNENHEKNLRALAAAMEDLPFSGALVPTARHEPIVAATYVATLTTRFKPLIAVLPGLQSPTSLANTALSFNELFNNRLIINIINVETPVARQHGVNLDNEERYELAHEYWGLFRRLVSGETFSHEGKYYKLENAGQNIAIKPTQDEFPLWFSGSSEAGHRLAAVYATNYLTFVEPLPLLSEKIARIRALAAEQGRTIRIGVRAPLIVRDTEKEAWDLAREHLEVSGHEVFKKRVEFVRRGGKRGGRSESVARVSGLITEQQLAAFERGEIPDNVRDLEIEPNLWAGNSVIRTGPPASLVGTPEQIIERLKQYEKLGVDTFILSASPLIEEARYVAETILPAFSVKTAAKAVTAAA